jgi:MFS family permease
MFVMVGGVILGTIAGVVVALTHCRWYVAIFLGAPAGFAIGYVIALLIAVPAGLPVLLAGCPLIVLYGVAVRYLSRPNGHNTARYSSRPKDRNTLSPGTLLPPPETLPEAKPSRLDQPWGARWDSPACGLPRRFGLGVLMLLVTLAAVLFSALRSLGACPEVFAVISTMFAAVAVGQIFLFRGRYPRAASIWVGGCFFPLQVVALVIWLSLAYGPAPIFAVAVMLLVSIPLGAGFGYLSGGLVGGVFLILDALAEKRRSLRDPAEER